MLWLGTRSAGVAAGRAQMRGTDARGYAGCMAAFLTLHWRDRIDRIRVPTLCISGADDHRGGRPALMQKLADAVPGARHTYLST